MSPFSIGGMGGVGPFALTAVAVFGPLAARILTIAPLLHHSSLLGSLVNVLGHCVGEGPCQPLGLAQSRHVLSPPELLFT